jgi:preprotein translocase subunit SecB
MTKKIAANETDVKETKEEAAKTGSEFAIHRIYLKDLSYEAPNTPEQFQIQGEPVVDFELSTKHKHLASDIYEVIIKISVTVKGKDKVAFLVELHEAGIFTLKQFSEERLQYMLGGYCPGLLFPYARALVSELVAHGTFPPFYLPPVNFDVVYQQSLQKQAQGKGTETAK